MHPLLGVPTLPFMDKPVDNTSMHNSPPLPPPLPPPPQRPVTHLEAPPATSLPPPPSPLFGSGRGMMRNTNSITTPMTSRIGRNRDHDVDGGGGGGDAATIVTSVVPASHPQSSKDSVASLLVRLNLSRHIEVLQEEGLDLDALAMCSDDDLKEIGLPKGARLKLVKWIRDRQGETAEQPAPTVIGSGTTRRPMNGRENESPVERLPKSYGMIAVPPPSYCCPISMFVMEDPVLCIGDGNTYERREIEGWFQSHHTSPMSNINLTEAGRSLVPNRSLKEAIGSWVAQHGYDMDNQMNNRLVMDK